MDVRLDPNFDPVVAKLEQDRGLPAGVLRALVGAESSGDSTAISPVGAQGLTQFMPATAKQYNVDVKNPWDSLRGTADYLYDLNKKYDGNIKAALSAYNGGGHNAQYFVDGTVPDSSKVSQKNHEINKGYVGQITSRMGGPLQPAPAQAPQVPQMMPIGALEAQVTDMVQQGMPTSYILTQIEKAGYGDTVKMAKGKGYKPEDIVTRIGGKTLAPVAAAMQDVAGRSGLSNAATGAGYAWDDLKAGASQIGSRLSGNDKALAQEQVQQAVAERDPTRRAVMVTTGGMVGNVGAKVAPSVVAAALTGGGSLVAQAGIQGAIGAASGAFTPTTGEGQFGSNIAMGAGAGALGGAIGAAATRLPSILVKSAQSAMRGGEAADVVAARMAAREAAGIQSSAADLSPRLSATADKISDSVMGSKWLGADMRAAREPEIARAITSRIGNEADELSAAVVKKAQQNVSQLYDDALDGVRVDLDPNFAATMDRIVADHASSTLPSLTSSLPTKVANDLKALASQGSVSARQLQSIRSKIGAEMSFGNDPAAKASLGQIRDAINETIEAKLPVENLAKFTKANEYYKNLQVVENYGRRTNWSGDDFSAKRFLTSAKAENKAAFERGDAPFQDLVGAIAGGEGAASGRSGVNALQIANLAGAYHTGGTSLIGSGIAGNMAMRILTDPKYAKVLLGLNPTQRAGLMQAAAAARAGGAAVGAEAAPRPQPTAQVLPFRRAA
ncbi:lytic transglycosylase domain-containing protein [Janthinobacterium sp. HSC-3S05]|uniref:lytic transglycosylase domain-containing protein n=1 Tax=Janthinobacterium lividum TaxID=29581 RepID=UPI001CD862F2|nr:lytic transglycosylase domain-containing protein [Janthinobacterium lividum]MCA1859318.1 lytic transglycosylase domain-containing protein [Janthinobacterium lividum]